MSKTHFLQNKEVTIALAIAIGMVCMLIINGALLIPTLVDVYKQDKLVTEKQPIDTEIVDQALNFITGEKQ